MPPGDLRARGNRGLARAVHDELAVDAGIRADVDFFGVDLGIALHDAVDANAGARGVQVFLRVAFETDASAGQRHPARDRRGRAQRDVTAGHARIAGDDCVDLHFAARDVEIVADAAADRDFAAHRDEVAFHFARRGDVPAGEHRVARDRIGEIERAAGAEVVRADLLRNGILAVALDAAACNDQPQGEHAQGPCDRIHIDSPRLPSPCRTGSRGILQAIVNQSRASPRARIRAALRSSHVTHASSRATDCTKEKAATRCANRGSSDAWSSVTARNRPPVEPSISSVARSPPACDCCGFVRALPRVVTLQRNNDCIRFTTLN